MPVQIVEILGRAERGVTLPFKCRGDDGNLYYVKGMGSHAGRVSLISEWIAGHLGLALGIPIAPFRIVDVPAILLDAGLPEWSAQLGAGPAFASRLLPLAQWLQFSQVAKIPERTQQDLLVFDWWVHNEDRHLTDQGGNPNLLWDTQNESLVVIDHNQAFDPAFDPLQFARSHVFSGQWRNVFEDCVTRASYDIRLQQALAVFETACNSCPDDWWWIDHGVPCSFDRNAAIALLSRINESSFWGIAR